MSAEEPEEPGDYGLVMPFVVVASAGGPYDDESFVAGCRFEAVWNELRHQPAEYQSYEYPALVPQLDLIAMKEGYTMTTEPWDEHPDEWALVTFTRRDAGA